GGKVSGKRHASCINRALRTEGDCRCFFAANSRVLRSTDKCRIQQLLAIGREMRHEGIAIARQGGLKGIAGNRKVAGWRVAADPNATVGSQLDGPTALVAGTSEVGKKVHLAAIAGQPREERILAFHLGLEDALGIEVG